MIDTSHYFLSFFEGLALAFSPCILPILPLILSGAAAEGRLRPYAIILGFIIFFTVFSLISRSLLSHVGIPQDTLQMASFTLLAVFGFIMLIPQLDTLFSKFTSGIAGKAQTLSTQSKFTSGLGGGLILGGLIGIVWTPCAGPLMAAALLQIIQSQTNFETTMTILAFASGAALPMLIIAIMGHQITHHIRALSAHTATIKRIMGVILIAFSVLGLSGINLGEAYVNAKMKTLTQNNSMIEQVSAQTGIINGLPTPYAAPPIEGIAAWVNSEPRTLESLKGKVVLVDFWTYSCINCIRTFPYLKSWYQKYHDQGFEIIGVHSPEFSFEKDLGNVQKAAQKYGLTYPIALDNDFATWKSFANQYWPAHYLINKEGQVVYVHYGEGNYDITEKNIQYLLGVNQGIVDQNPMVNASINQSPETYLGLERAARETKDQNNIALNEWYLSDGWSRHPQFIQSEVNNAELQFHALSSKMFLVLDTADNKPITVKILIKRDGAKEFTEHKTITVNQASLYDLVELDHAQNFTAKIIASTSGLKAFAFTFG